MTGIAKVTSTCRACGGKILKNIHTIDFTPGDKGSARHEACAGKPDRFNYDGTVMQGDGTGLSTVIKKPAKEKLAPIPVEAPTKIKPSHTGFYVPDEPEVFQDLGSNEAQEILASDAEEPQDEPMTPPAPVALPSDPMAAMMATALAPYLESKLKGKVDENTVRRIIKEVATAKSKEELKIQEEAITKAVKAALEERGTVLLSVKQANGDITKLEGLQHKETPKLMGLMLLRKNIYLHGPTGSGKSTAARKCATAIKTVAHPNGLPFRYVSLNPQSSPTRIEGYKTPSGDDIITHFIECYEFGGVFCADEVDNSMANLWTSVNNAIDSDLGSFPKGMVKRHPDFIFIGTGNTNLSGSSVYKDRKALDKATIARFVFWEWNYDIGLEKAITLGINPKAAPWLDWVHKVRVFSKVNNPALFAYAHPRASYDGADMLRSGVFSIAECADACLFKQSFDQTAKHAALQACPLPTEEMSA